MSGAPDEARIAWTIVAVTLIVGAVLVVVIPPFQSPDEPAHFYRAIVAAGIGEPTRTPMPGGIVPQPWVELHAALLPAGTRPADMRRALREAASIRESDRLRFVPFPGAAMHAIVPYVPQIGGAWIARALDLSPLGALFAVRATNFLAAALLVIVAVRISDRYRLATATIAALPMMMFSRATASPDALTTSAALVVFAAATGRSASIAVRGPWFIAAAAVLASSKLVYFLLPLAAAPLFGADRRTTRHVIGATAVTVLACALATAAIAAATLVPMNPEAQTDPDAQIETVLKRPFAFAGIALADYGARGSDYLRQLLGVFGWLDVPLPLALVLIVGIGALVAGISGEHVAEVDLARRVGIAIVLVATMAAISLSQYVAWTPVGSRAIEGIQGRYFLPLLPFLVPLLPRTTAARSHAPWLIGGAAMAGAISTLAVIASAYWI